MKSRLKATLITTLGIISAFLINIGLPVKTFADFALTVSPMTQRISLTPGETYYGTFLVSNPSTSTSTLNYTLEIEPFTIDAENHAEYKDNGNYTLMKDWIALKKTEGTLEPNEKNEVEFSITVPKTAPAGGQYASIIVRSATGTDPGSGVNIQASYGSAHLIYAEVAGETVRNGTINYSNLSSFLFSGQITGGAEVTNNGNVHANAIHTLQVFPLFSDEEYYTNAEEPQENLIMPGGTRYTSVKWDNTPAIGIFRVVYTVEFEGVKDSLSKLVIICPVWLLFIIAVVIFLLVFKFIFRKKKAEA